MIHAATLKTSPRLQRALKALKAHPKGLTTWAWGAAARICAPNTVAAELRAQGYPVECRYLGTDGDSKLYRYRLGAK